MPYGKRTNYRKGAKKPAAKPKKNGIKVSKPVINPVLKRYVKKIVNGTEERKQFNLNLGEGSAIVGSGISSTGTVYGYTTPSSVIPVIQGGVGVQQRVGNRIRPTSCYIQGFVRALPVNTANNNHPNDPFYVRIVLFRHKTSMITASNSDIIDDQNTGGGVPFDGSVNRMLMPYNKDKYLIGGSRQFKLQPCSTIGTGALENLAGIPSIGIFKMKVPLPKTMVYNDNLSNEPQNARWYLSVGIVNSSGVLSPNTTVRATFTAQCYINYTDA